MYKSDDLELLLEASDRLAYEVEKIISNPKTKKTDLVLALSEFRSSQIRALRGVSGALDELENMEHEYQTYLEQEKRKEKNAKENEENTKYNLQTDLEEGNVNIVPLDKKLH